jgi:hypothetical protein
MEEALPEIEERNRSSLERLRAVGSSLSDAELERTIDAPWTTAALFAHIGFWDRFVRVRWEGAARDGRRTPTPVDDALALKDEINEASLASWLATPARDAVEGCLASASAIDDLVSSVPSDVIAELVEAGQQRLVDRSLHRGDHLRTIEEAFPSA